MAKSCPLRRQLPSRCLEQQFHELGCVAAPIFRRRSRSRSTQFSKLRAFSSVLDRIPRKGLSKDSINFCTERHLKIVPAKEHYSSRKSNSANGGYKIRSDETAVWAHNDPSANSNELVS